VCKYMNQNVGYHRDGDKRTIKLYGCKKRSLSYLESVPGYASSLDTKPFFFFFLFLDFVSTSSSLSSLSSSS